MALEPRQKVEAEERREEVVALVVCRARLTPFAALAALAACAAGLALAGCGPVTPAEKAQADMVTFRKEATTTNLLDRGRGFAAVGDMTRAEEYLSAALDQGADAREVLPLLIEVCVRTGRYRSAIQHGEDHLRKYPDDVRTRFVVGSLYVAIGETKDAKANLETVVTARPDDAKAHYALAVLARDNENDVVGADKHFREYLRIEPNGAHAEEARASLLKRMP
jgi:Tfp pilus assembly protein PilF